MHDFLARLGKRKLVQWTVAYLAGAWLCLEAFDLVAEQFQWPFWVRQGATVGLLSDYWSLRYSPGIMANVVGSA